MGQLNIRRERQEQLWGAGRARGAGRTWGFVLAAGSLPPCGSSAAIWARARCRLAASAGTVGRIGAGGQTSLSSHHLSLPETQIAAGEDAGL